MRILHIGSTLAVAGGIESFIINLYSNIEDKNIIFDFMVKTDQESGYYASYIKKRGGNIFGHDWDGNIFKCIVIKWKIYRKYKRDILHIHTNCGIRILDGIIAKFAGCENIIYHSHTCKGKPPFKYKILQPIYRLLGDCFFSCSLNAAKYFFGDKIANDKRYHLIHNAIDVEKYKFNDKVRTYLKNKLNIYDEYVLGFVGRMSKEKNIPFVVEVFKELLQYRKSKLLIIGDGEEREDIVKLIKDSNIEKDVIMLGNIDTVNELLTVFDGLILPSNYEGLGIVLIEAQASGLPCYASTNIPQEVEVTELLHFLKLDSSAEHWAKYIFQKGINNNRNEKYVMDLKKAGYDAASEAEVTLDLYKQMLDTNKR